MGIKNILKPYSNPVRSVIDPYIRIINRYNEKCSYMRKHLMESSAGNDQIAAIVRDRVSASIGKIGAYELNAVRLYTCGKESVGKKWDNCLEYLYITLNAD